MDLLAYVKLFTTVYDAINEYLSVSTPFKYEPICTYWYQKEFVTHTRFIIYIGVSQLSNTIISKTEFCTRVKFIYLGYRPSTVLEDAYFVIEYKVHCIVESDYTPYPWDNSLLRLFVCFRITSGIPQQGCRALAC